MRGKIAALTYSPTLVYKKAKLYNYIKSANPQKLATVIRIIWTTFSHAAEKFIDKDILEIKYEEMSCELYTSCL